MKNLSFVSLSDYTSPQIIEDKTKDWVKYGIDNNYYQYLIDLYHTSPTNNACIRGTADLIYGNGLEVVRADRHLKGYLEFKMLFDEEEVQKVVLDLKMLGQAAFQLVKSKNKKRYAKAYHFPIQTLRCKKANEEGEIEGYYYCADWAKLKRNEQPKEFAAFGFDENANECILVIKAYSTGSYYYAPVDYQGGTQWSELEAEISNFHLNNIKNGMAPSMLINFNNGEPPEDSKQMIENAISAKFSGSSNAGRFIISWNDDPNAKADITPVQLSDAHNQYQFLSTECMQKVMLSHRITSPMLLGIKDNTGFGNNAEEIQSASILFDNTVIRPFQNLIIRAVKKVLIANQTPVDLYFKTLQPLEFTDLSGKQVDKATQEKEYGFSVGLSEVKMADSYTDYPEGATSNAKKALAWAEEHGWGDCGTGVGKARANQLAKREPISRDTIARMASFKRHEQNKDVPYSEGCGGLMWDAWGGTAGINWAIRKLEEIDSQKNSTQLSQHIDMSEEDESYWISFLEEKGEVINLDEWELVEEVMVDPDFEEPTTKLLSEYSDPDAKSADDKGIYKIRYRYGPNSLKSNSRHFCKQMVAARNRNVVYRREDIDKMQDEGVNSAFSPKGRSTYSIWRFKGGVYCHHAWYRVTFRRKYVKGRGNMPTPITPIEKETNTRDMKYYDPVSNTEANQKGVPFSPPNWKEAKTRPIDMPSRGRYEK